MKKYNQLKLIDDGKEQKEDVIEINKSSLVELKRGDIIRSCKGKSVALVSTYGSLRGRALFLSSDYIWDIVKHGGYLYAIPTKKEK